MHAFQGLIWTPLGGLSETGPVLRGWAKSDIFTYKTHLSRHHKTEIKVTGTSLEGEAGYQFATSYGHAALFTGIVWRDHKLHPHDPQSDLDKARTAPSLGADASWLPGTRFGVMANGKYIFRFKQYWAQLKPFYQTEKGLKFGLDTGLSGGPDYLYGRTGLFVSGYRLDLALVGTVYLGGELGVKYGLEEDRVEPYAGIHIGRGF